MNKTIKTVTILSFMSMMAVGCQKENFSDISQETTISEVGTVYMVQYTINGVQYMEKIVGEQAWSDFLHRMLTLAEQGYEVQISKGNNPSNVAATKEVVTFTTSNQEEAYSWCDKMIAADYVVTFDYDKEKNVYTCVAVKK